MGTHVLDEVLPVGADHEAQLQGRLGVGRHGVERAVRIAGLEGQHLQGVPGEDPLGRGEARLAPVGIDRGRGRVLADADVGERRAHALGDRRRPQGVHQDAAPRVDHRGDRRGQHRAGVAQQAAPVAGMVRALAQVEAQLEIVGAAGAQEEGRALAVEARPVRGDQHVGPQGLGLRPAERPQARGAGFLTHLDQQLHVEADAPVAGRDHLLQGGEVEDVLALVVGGAAPVPAVALDHDLPGAQPLAPLLGIAPHRVAVAVDQHGRQVGALVPLGDQERAVHPVRVREDFWGREAEPGHQRHDEGIEVGAQGLLLAGGLALGRHRHRLPQEREERARVEGLCGARDGGVSRHGVFPVKQSGAGPAGIVSGAPRAP